MAPPAETPPIEPPPVEPAAPVEFDPNAEITQLSQVAASFGASEDDFLEIIQLAGAKEGDPGTSLRTIIDQWKNPTSTDHYPMVATRLRELDTRETALNDQHQGALAQLQRHMTAMIAAVGDEDNVNWDRLREELQPHEYLDRKERFEKRRQAFQGALMHIEGEEKRVAGERQEASTTRMNGEAKALLTAMPSWKDDKVLDAAKVQMNVAANSVGITAAELNEFTDHRHLVILWQASEYQRIKKAARARLPGLRHLPKVTLKAGARRAEGAEGSQRRLKVLGAHQRIGTEHSAAKAIEALIDL